MADRYELKSQLDALEKEYGTANGRIKEIKPAHRAASEALSQAETGKKVADFALTRNKNNKAWLLLMIVGAAFLIGAVVIAFYWQKSPDVHSFAEGFTYNGEPIFLSVIGAAVAAVGLVFLIVRLSKAGKLAEAAKTADEAYDEKKKAFDEIDAKLSEAQKEADAVKAKRDAAEKAYLEADPEAKKRKEAEEKAQENEALNELRRIEEINKEAAEKAQKKAADRMEADKMFEHPQAYVLDGKYENEYEVFKAAAEMGSPEAQERVINYMLGIAYKNGLTPDVKAGEEKALQFAADNSAMYEQLGKAFLYGEGSVEKDEEKALRYLERASVKGRQNAMIMAGVCYYNGVGTEKDEARARTFFEKAAKQGNEQAIQVVYAMDNGQKLRF